MITRRTWPVAVLLVVALSGAAACGDGDVAARPTGDGGRIVVLAAASLTDAFTAVGRAFEAANPDAQVTFSFGASSTLATQANQGAPADVFASADEADMAKVTGAGNAADPTPFARNRLAILVGRGNPRRISGLADLARPGVSFVLCAAEVPCGRLGTQVLERAGVTARPRSYEDNVRGVVAKVTLGEVDAGIVYVTDVAAAGDQAHGVDIPVVANAESVYVLAILEQAGKADLARAFTAFVASEEGQQILARHGFLPPA